MAICFGKINLVNIIPNNPLPDIPVLPKINKRLIKCNVKFEFNYKMMPTNWISW